MSDSNDVIVVDPKVDHRNVSTNITGDLQITATFDGSSSHTSSNANVHEKEPPVSVSETRDEVCRSYQKYGNCKRQNCKYEHVDFDDIKDVGVVSNDSKVPSKNSNKVPTKEKECTYFMSQNGCKFNDQCAFKHYRGEADAGSCHEDDEDSHIKGVVIAEEDLDKELNRSKTTNNKTRSNKTENGSKTNSSKVCKFFLSEKGCTRSHCNFVHESRNGDSSKSGIQQDFIDNDENKVHKNTGKDISNTKKLNTTDTDKDIVKENKIVKEDNNKKTSDTFHNKGCAGSNKEDECPNLHNIKNNPVTKEKIDTNNSKNDVSAETFEEQPHDKKKIANNKKKKICKYFNSQKGCSNDDCPFRHVLKEAATDRSENENSDSKLGKHHADPENQNKTQNGTKTNKVCRFFQSEKGCYRGTKCLNIHDNENNQIVKDMDNLKLENIDYKSKGAKSKSQQQQPTAQELRSTELTQLEKRWKDHFECVQKEPASIYKVTIQPTDPDWVRT